MTTGFLITEGYHSGYLGDSEDAWDVMVKVFDLLLTHHSKSLENYSYEFGFVNRVLDPGYSTFADWSLSYLSSGAKVLSPDDIQPYHRIFISASGGGDSRTCKEAIALAVCHIMFHECAKQGILISISID